MNVELFEAHSGVAALQHTQRAPVDLITLDIEMGGLSGYHVLRQLRSCSSTRGAKVIMVSGRPNEQERFRAQEEGAHSTRSICCPRLIGLTCSAC